MPSTVIMDPYGPYARLLIERLYRNHGVTTVCLHTDWKARLRSEGEPRSTVEIRGCAGWAVG
ncbi:MAG TPA: hypothetical protein PKL68_05800 [Actinomycetota bacterium]|nr:hypothetical protein [Actinomycetota bacterium]HNL51450.1 hypothetical protein [Actinomycetota bacterium]HNO15011.1 hypothetical protein [Actinomycetota bacterium]